MIVRRIGVGLLAAALLSHAPAVAQAHGAQLTSFELFIDDVYTQQTGGESFSVSFRDPLTRKLNPQLRVREGDAVVIHVVNRSSQPHGFEIMNVSGTTSAAIPSGGSATLRFAAPGQGSYIYHDPLQARAGGARTLFGDFTVMPR
jgi:FtsP/CotA-like multicopper oxidase with cupredoxin domain